MNALEQTMKTQDEIIKTINESGLPLTTIYYMLQDLQRQIVEASNRQPEEAKPVEAE